MVFVSLLKPNIFLRKIHLCIVLVTIVLFLGLATPVLAEGLDNWNWRNPMTQSTTLNSVAYGNNTFVEVAANGEIYTSPDGITWTGRTSGTTNALFGVTYGNDTFVAVGTAGTILTSLDGIAWIRQTSGTTVKDCFYGITYGNGNFVAVGNGNVDGVILTSPDGITWIRQTFINNSFNGVTYGNGTFVAVGRFTMLTSPDSLTWTDRKTDTTGTVCGITYGNNTFVAVGWYGAILTSSDCITWTKQTSGVTQWLNGVTYGNNTFVAVGDYGVILTSSDGITWTSRNSGFIKYFYGVTYGNNTFVVVGSNGTILQSDPLTILQSIAISTPATKLSYTVGDTLDITGLVVTGTYSDESTKAESIAATDITGFNSTTAVVDQVLTITVGDKTTSYKVQIEDDIVNHDYTYTVTDGETQITKYTGDGGDVTVPSTLGGAPVTSIGDSAFRSCTYVTSINIPEGVTSIGDGAFYFCEGLTAITVVLDNSKYESIDGVLYNKAGTILIQCPQRLTTISIPEGVTSIGNGAFLECTGLTSISIPDGVTSIGNSAFRYCSGLTSIGIPEGVTSIGDNAFEGCSNLTSISLPEGLTRISNDTFWGCTGLTSISIPERVTSIDVQAFTSCSGLTSINIPEGVTNIGALAFQGCYGLITIRFNSETTVIDESYAMTIPTATKIIGYDPSTAKDYASKYGRTFEAIERTNTLQSIAINTPATKLSYTVGDELDVTGLSVIGTYSDASTKLEVITSANVTGFDSTVAARDQVLTITVSGMTVTYNVQIVAAPVNSDYTYTITDGNAQITGYTGSGRDVTIPSTVGGFPVTSIGNGAFFNCIGLTSINLPQGVTSIGDYAFNGCTSLTSVSIPQAVTSIGYSAFFDCSSLTSINLPQGVTSIGMSAFYGCTGLTSISIPQGVTSIAYTTFYGCRSLTTISIPQGVTSIGNYAFYGCTDLISIRFNSAAISIYDDANIIPTTTKIIGYDPSTAKAYAEKYHRTFKVLDITAGVSLNTNSISSSEIDLTWTAVSGATSYNVYRSTVINGIFNKIGNVSISDFNDDTVSSSTTYYYKISVVYDDGEGDLSDALSVTTLTPPQLCETLVELGTSSDSNNEAGLFIGLGNLLDSTGTSLTGYSIEIDFDPTKVGIFGVTNMVHIPNFSIGLGVVGQKATINFIGNLSGDLNRLLFIPLRLSGSADEITTLTIKFLSIEANSLETPDPITLSFQRGKILNDGTTIIALNDAVAGLQYLAGIKDDTQINVVNMASILPEENKPSVKNVIALMQNLVGIRDDSFQLVSR